MSDLYLYRAVEFNDSICGVLVFCGGRFFTLELPWKNNARNVSCIPAGRYECRYTENRRTSGGMVIDKTLEVMDVPGRSGILFHVGNYSRDSQGCILVGSSIYNAPLGQGMIQNSRRAFDIFSSLLDDRSDYTLHVFSERL